MNLFILDTNPQLCAQYHSDVHVNKMATECGQILTAALAVVTKSYDEVQGKTKMVKKWRKPFADSWGVSHPHHPATVWVAQSRQNALWAWHLWRHLCNEWYLRFAKPHGSISYAATLSSHIGKFPDIPQTPHVIAFNRDKYADCIVEGDVVQSYRNYYIASKLILPTKGKATWTRRDRPHWLPSDTE